MMGTVQASLMGHPEAAEAMQEVAQRVAKLSKRAFKDLEALRLEHESSTNEDEQREIREIILEIIFPELVGRLVPAAQVKPKNRSKSLEARKGRIARKIQDLRQAKGMTQAELAEASELPQSHISRLESGTHSPSQKTLDKLARGLGVSVGDIDASKDDH